jgi:pimeloyl-ACP methyl ester carboxylesterase
MAKFVLVHGSWQGAWCWREMIPRLLSSGHEAEAIDLPGHGEDRASVESVTFQQYVERTLEAVNVSKDPLILVGHSMAGAIVREAAGLAPDCIRAIVSVASLLPRNGASMLSLVEGFDPEYLAQILWAEDRRTARLSPEGVRRFAYFRCPQATVDAVLPLLTAEPIAPYETPLSVRDAGVPHYYIECLRDRIVPIALQRSMHAGFPPDRIYALDTDHAPFFSMPDEFASILNSIAEGRGTTPFGGRHPAPSIAE